VDSVIYAAGHFLVDFSCALIMLSVVDIPWQFVLYNFLAFAVQMPLGLLADLFGRNRYFALIGIALVLSGYLPCPVLLRVVLIGLGNACYHIGGGREALLKKNGLTGLGIFVSPGAVGILLGTMFVSVSWLHLVVMLALAVCGILIYFLCNAKEISVPKGNCNIPLASIMMSVVLLRSLIGMCMETPWKIDLYVILGALAAALGKALGGVFADRFGWKVTGMVSLIAAAGLFLLPESGVTGVLGVLLFNMTMPITLGKASDNCPGYEGFAFGLLTFGLFLGYLPSAFGLTIPPIVGFSLALISAGLLAASQEDHHG